MIPDPGTYKHAQMLWILTYRWFWMDNPCSFVCILFLLNTWLYRVVSLELYTWDSVVETQSNTFQPAIFLKWNLHHVLVVPHFLENLSGFVMRKWLSAFSFFLHRTDCPPPVHPDCLSLHLCVWGSMMTRRGLDWWIPCWHLWSPDFRSKTPFPDSFWAVVHPFIFIFCGGPRLRLSSQHG